MTKEYKTQIVKDYFIKLEKDHVRIIINEIDDFSDHPIRPWVKIFYSIIKRKNKLYTKVDKVWSEYGTFDSLFISEIRDQRLNDLGV